VKYCREEGDDVFANRYTLADIMQNIGTDTGTGTGTGTSTTPTIKNISLPKSANALPSECLRQRGTRIARPSCSGSAWRRTERQPHSDSLVGGMGVGLAVVAVAMARPIVHQLRLTLKGLRNRQQLLLQRRRQLKRRLRQEEGEVEGGIPKSKEIKKQLIRKVLLLLLPLHPPPQTLHHSLRFLRMTKCIRTAH
jgi:hypothetical protein